MHADRRPKPNQQEENLPALPQEQQIPIGKRIWTDVEPREYSLSDYAVSKKLIHLLAMEHKYIEKMMERLNSGESKTIFRIFPALSSLV